MDKDKIVEALNAIQNGTDAGHFHDELEVVIGLVMNASDEDIAAVIQEIHEDAENGEEAKN
jgi:hypothetical protein